MSTVLIFIRAMTDIMRNIENNVDQPNEIKDLVIALLSQLNSRFTGYEDNEIVTQAALFDPRFKKMAFSGYNPRKLEVSINT